MPVLTAVPLVIHFTLGHFSIWENINLSRFVAGALLSSLAVFYIIPGLIELSEMIGRRCSALTRISKREEDGCFLHVLQLHPHPALTQRERVLPTTRRDILARNLF